MRITEEVKVRCTSGGMRDAMCAKSAGRCGRGRVSTMNASLVGSYGEGGGGGGGHSGGGCSAGHEGVAAGREIGICISDSMVERFCGWDV